MTLQQKIRFAHVLTQTSFFVVLLLMIIWPTLLFPSKDISPIFTAELWTLPLLFPAIGIYQRKLYTYAWAQFINMIYFSHAIMYLMISDTWESLLAAVELIFVLVFFFATILAIRWSKQQKLAES